MPLVACGDDKGDSDSNATATDATATDPTTSTTETTADLTSTTGLTTTMPGTTTDEPMTSTTDEPETTTSTTTTTTEPTSTTEPATSTTDETATTADETTTTTTGDALSWEMDIFPMVVAGNCGCHSQGPGSGGLKMSNAMDSYMNLVDVDSTQSDFKRVAPGDSGASYFLAKIKGVGGEAPFDGNDTQMPLGGMPLSDDVIAMLEQWIDEGAAP